MFIYVFTNLFHLPVIYHVLNLLNHTVFGLKNDVILFIPFVLTLLKRTLAAVRFA